MPLTANSDHTNSKRLRLAIVCLFLLSVVVLPLPVLSANIHLESDSDVATAGYFRLSWGLNAVVEKDTIEYQLQRSNQPDFARFKVAYLGPDLARVVSGKANGDYYYRIRAIQHGVPITEWSDVAQVSVAHHSLFRALMFFAAGAVIFFALLVFILSQNKRD
jgi:hypothetical protein